MSDVPRALCTSSTTARSTLAALALLATAAGCSQPVDELEERTASATSEIVGGQTTSAFAAVGALTMGGNPFCTGTVVAKRTVVTAAHCLDGARSTWLRFVLGPSALRPQASLRVARAVAHPGYSPSSVANDIAVLVLAEDAPVTPIPVNTTPMDASWIGRELTFVGYGVTSGLTQQGSGLKREVDIAVAQLGSTQFAYVDRQRNTCSGDSGGPALTTVDGREVVVGVTSYGDEACRLYGVDTRVDAFVESFLAPFLP